MGTHIARLTATDLQGGGAWLGAGATWRARQWVRSTYTQVARQASPYQLRFADELGDSWVLRG